MVSYISEIRDTLKDIMLTDRATVLMGMNISSGGLWGESDGLGEFISSKRLIDTPYSISSVAGAALGLAMSGAKPIFTVKGEYLLKAVDTLANKISVNTHLSGGSFPSNMLILSETGFSANKGVQGVSVYENIVAGIKGLMVLVISQVRDVRRILYSAYKYDGPVLVLFNTAALCDEGERSEVPYIAGKAQTVRSGDDVSVITYGPALEKVMKACELASEQGIETEVTDLVCISEIDMQAVEKTVEKTGHVIIVHDSRASHGVGSEIAAKIAQSEVFFYLEDRIIRICGKDIHIPYSKEECGVFTPSVEEILQAILTVGK